MSQKARSSGRIGRHSILIAALLLMGRLAGAQSYTIAPTPFQTFLDNSGRIVNNGCIWTYVAGTSTAATTYSDNVGTPNLNPIRSGSDGRFTAFLIPGSAYKFQYEATCTPPSTHGSVLRTADNINAMPGAAATVDIPITAGESVTLGQALYLSFGDGSKTPGLWYKADNANAYSSILHAVGIVTTNVAASATGTVRAGGEMTGLSALVAGTEYYVGTAGALTATKPTSNARLVGQADATTSIVVAANPALGNIAALQGKQTLWVPAVAMSPTITNGATGPTVTELTAANPNITVLSFVNGSTKNAQFGIGFPKSWNAGTVTYQAYWTGTAAGAGTTIWGLQCVASADGATIDTAFGTAQEVTDTFLTVKQVHVAAESSAVTISGAAADTYTTCQIYRKGASDTRAAASLLLGVKFYYSTSAGNDQ